jgi:hypothetical protein
MTISPIVLQAQAATAAGAFTIGDAAAIFVAVVVVLGVIVAITGRRSRRLASRPRLRTAHSRRVRRAAEEDLEALERWNQRQPETPDREDDEL